MKKALLLSLCLLTCMQSLYAQAKFTSKEFWLQDDLTIPFNDSERTAFNGLRLLFEPQFGIVMPWGTNRLEVENITQIPRIGVETNLNEGWLALQLSFLAPTPVTFDAKSSVIIDNVIPSNNKVQLDAGVAAGFSLLNGVIVLGIGYLNYDQRDFNRENPKFNNDQTSDFFGYINFQPLTAIRTVISSVKNQ